jgi:hypothetical protein
MRRGQNGEDPATHARTEFIAGLPPDSALTAALAAGTATAWEEAPPRSSFSQDRR